MRAKKSLGQNFLHNKDTLEFIIDKLNIKKGDTVVEIGGGTGNLTEYLIEKESIDLKIIEIDDELVDRLKDIAGDKAEVIKNDILKYPLDFTHNIIIVGNIPYYITKPIIKHIYKYREHIKRAILMVQYEVAKAFTAKPSEDNYNAFTLFLRNFADVKFLKKVNRGEFTPRPKVHSALISLHIRDKKNIYDKPDFIEFIFMCFRHKRKTLSNNLKKKYDKEKVNGILDKLAIKRKVRAEELMLEEIKMIYKKLNRNI